MLYSNEEISVTKKEMDWGTSFSINAGEAGERRSFMPLPCREFTRVYEGMNEYLVIGHTRKGKPCIKQSTMSKEIYLLLSAKGHNKELLPGNGRIYAMTKDFDKFYVIAKGYGGEGELAKKSKWDVFLLYSPKDCIFRVKYRGASKEIPNDIFLISNGVVFKSNINEIEELCKNLNIEVPCKIMQEKSGRKIFGNDWKKIR